MRFAAAANVTEFSNTLSDSAPSVGSNQTLAFTLPSELAAGEAITLTYPAGFSDIGSIVPADVDVALDGTDATVAASPSGTTWGFGVSGQVLTFTNGTAAVATGTEVTIEVGTNATDGSTGTNQITNPAAGSYAINLTAGSDDSGETRVSIVDRVVVTATVDTIFNFEIGGLGIDTKTADSPTTTVVTTPTSIPFGELAPETDVSGAQSLTVETNAANGFVVTVATDQQLTSANGADIDSFADGTYVSTPQSWSDPGGSTTDENQWGHWGLTSTDTTTTLDFNSGESFVAASTTPVEVMRHTGPTDGSGEAGVTNVFYQVNISPLQEAADDYTATLTYVATPVF
jgi:hypothetical protein